MSRKSASFKGIEVVYSHSGCGETVLLLHGFLEERSMWNEYAEVLSEKYTVICPDLLGHGETDCLGYVHSMSLQAEAVAAVLESEKVVEFSVVGHSMGGYVALELARIYPQRIAHLVLFHSTAYADSEARRLDRERVIELVQRSKSVYVKTVIPTLFADGSREALQEEIRNIAAKASRFSEQGIIANIRGMIERSPGLDVLEFGPFKKLLLHGEFDSIIPTSDMEKLALLNENIMLKTISGIGHMGHLEAPHVCLDAIQTFLAD
ncbi:MAG: hypothetical protein RL266_894 [Bacteroidota bacterium]|jgi:pimeloyl-ACP methyl ester carboxylesterase